MYRFILVFVVMFSGNVAAQNAAFNCKNPQYQQEMNYCAHQEFLHEDEKLNAVYGLAVISTKATDSYQEPDQRGAEQALREAQRAWIVYRDNACVAEGYVFHNGSMEPLMVSVCKSRLTRERTEGLRLLSEMN